MAEVEWAILCDYAFQDSARKTCIIGAFDRIYTQVVPAHHHQAALVVKFVGEAQEDISFRVEIVRPSGGTIGTVAGQGKLGDTGTSEFITNIAGLPIPDWGIYSFNIFIDDKKAPDEKKVPKTVSFVVAKIQAPAKPEV